MSVKALYLCLKLTEELRDAKHTENSEGRVPPAGTRKTGVSPVCRSLGCLPPADSRSPTDESCPHQPPTMNPEPGTMNHSPIPITPPLQAP
jgi:Rieske Fe-S protein